MRLLLLALLLLAPVSCRTIQSPTGYLPLEPHGELVYHAVAPNGNRIEIREHENREEGTVDYWARAVRRELVEGRGYSVQGEREIRSRDEAPGREILFSAEHQLREYLYLVAITADAGRVQIVEAGGERTALEPDLPAIRAMVDTLD